MRAIRRKSTPLDDDRELAWFGILIMALAFPRERSNLAALNQESKDSGHKFTKPERQRLRDWPGP
jgi:hypothetical protein